MPSKSHAAAFAVLTYQSAWLQRYHPAAFFAGLLRHQPMGFYPPHVIISKARRCGVEVRPVDAEASQLLSTVEGPALSADRRSGAEGAAIRLGLGTVTGLGETGGRSVVEARRFGPFRSLADFCRRTKLGRRAVGLAVVVHIGHHAGMIFNTPAASVVAIVPKPLPMSPTSGYSSRLPAIFSYHH
jgi:DNA polymerase III alpha subunit